MTVASGCFSDGGGRERGFQKSERLHPLTEVPWQPESGNRYVHKFLIQPFPFRFTPNLQDQTGASHDQDRGGKTLLCGPIQYRDTGS